MEIIIETTKGSNVKYKYDEGSSCFKVKKILPMGMVFPYHFGFIPGTKGEDGDPLDGMVISEFSSFTGGPYRMQANRGITCIAIGKRKDYAERPLFFCSCSFNSF